LLSFQDLRFVCKSWKDVVESIRFDRLVPIDDWIFDFEQNGKFEIFISKYLKAFTKLELNITSQISMKWDSVTKSILQNMKNLNSITFDLNFKRRIPQNFDSFALQLFQNSQSTLKILSFDGDKILPLPIISLPKVKSIHFQAQADHDEQIEQFINFVQKILENCEYLETFFIYDIDDSIQISEYIAQNYPDNCLHAHYLGASQELPTKMSYCPTLSYLHTLKYPSSVKALLLEVVDFNRPYGEKWEDYKSILALCSNLKKICMVSPRNQEKEIELDEALQNIFPENQDIWKERIQYLKSCGIEIINSDQFNASGDELSKQTKWAFTFTVHEHGKE
jgi:hypothetical protein